MFDSFQEVDDFCIWKREGGREVRQNDYDRKKDVSFKLHMQCIYRGPEELACNCSLRIGTLVGPNKQNPWEVSLREVLVTISGMW